jgi:hypothetical protein
MSLQGKRPDELEDAAPPRLLDDPTSSALVRHDLSNAAGAAPNYDAAAGLLALQAALGATAKVATAGSAATSATASTTSTAAKGGLAFKLAIAGALSAVALVGAAMLFWPSHDLPPPAQRAPAAQHAPAAAPHIPRSAGASEVPVLAAPALTEAPAVAEPPLQPQPQARAEATVSQGPRDRAAEEIAQLAQIKALVKGAPARALRLAEQGHRQFSEGYLHHEREGLAIIALHALGRRDEAHARAQRYLARYPHSSLSERVRALETDGPKP